MGRAGHKATLQFATSGSPVRAGRLASSIRLQASHAILSAPEHASRQHTVAACDAPCAGGALPCAGVATHSCCMVRYREKAWNGRAREGAVFGQGGIRVGRELSLPYFRRGAMAVGHGCNAHAAPPHVCVLDPQDLIEVCCTISKPVTRDEPPDRSINWSTEMTKFVGIFKPNRFCCGFHYRAVHVAIHDTMSRCGEFLPIPIPMIP